MADTVPGVTRIALLLSKEERLNAHFARLRSDPDPL